MHIHSLFSIFGAFAIYLYFYHNSIFIAACPTKRNLSFFIDAMVLSLTPNSNKWRHLFNQNSGKLHVTTGKCICMVCRVSRENPWIYLIYDFLLFLFSLYTSVDFSIEFLGTGRVWFHFCLKQFFKLPLQINMTKQYERREKNTWNVSHKYCVFCTNAKSTCNDHFWWNRWWIAIVSAPLCECVDFPFAIHIHISRNSPNSRPSELNWLEIYVRNKFYQKSHLCARFSITFYQ